MSGQHSPGYARAYYQRNRERQRRLAREWRERRQRRRWARWLIRQLELEFGNNHASAEEIEP